MKNLDFVLNETITRGEIMKKNNYKEFVLWFRSYARAGAPITTNDLRHKAVELGLPIPKKYKLQRSAL